MGEEIKYIFFNKWELTFRARLLAVHSLFVCWLVSSRLSSEPK